MTSTSASSAPQCGECGFDWSLDTGAAAALISRAPDRYTSLLDGRDGSRPPAPGVWSPAAYTCHVADNTRIWAERVWQAATDPGSKVAAPYDQDALALARRYDLIPQATALWSFARSVDTWKQAVEGAEPTAEMRHPEYGVLDVASVIRRVAHEVHHHEMDIHRGLGLT